MRFELATGGLLEWIGRLITDRIASPTTAPRGLVILLLAVACWLLVAGLVWLAIIALQAL